MSCLLELQQQLRGALATDGADLPLHWFSTADGTIAERFDVYRQTILGTLTRALRLTFPSVERLVGREFFEAAAQVFVRQEIPLAADLNAYGGGFPNFLGSFAPCAALPYLPDTARLDWAVARALHAPDLDPLALETLAGFADTKAESLCFTFHPAVSLLASHFPIDAIWSAVLERDEDAMARIDLGSGSVHLLVERAEDAPRVLRLQSAEWNFARELMAGRPMGELLARFDESDIPVRLAQHLSAGRLVAFSTHAAGSGGEGLRSIRGRISIAGFGVAK